jgi:hypothetical protein
MTIGLLDRACARRSRNEHGGIVEANIASGKSG